VPVEAPVAQFRHPAFGEPTQVWVYKGRGGELLGYVARFDVATGKQILPRTYCRLVDGSKAWRWKGFLAPRPLYGLDSLVVHPEAPVLVVEGEKTADAAAIHFPDHVVVTWPGGSNAYRKVDWTPLADRRVVLWPDADVAGHSAMTEIADLLMRAGAAEVNEVCLPENVPEGWDLADPLPGNLDAPEIMASAAPAAQPFHWPPGYSMKGRGLVWRDPLDEDKPEWLLAGPFEVVAETRDQDGGSWGVLLQWYDHDQRRHRFALPRSMLAGDGADARRALLDGGLYVAPTRGSRERLTALLTSVHSPARVTATSRVGWHGSTFVLPDECIRHSSGEEVMLQTAGAIEHTFHQRGTLREWQDGIARYAVGNSRLAFALSTAFAAALVKPCEAEGGGLHFRGASSIGKTTALSVAGSVWGGGEPGGYTRSWRATSNGLESVALGHCDALLCLDEMAQVSARDASEVAYMLANGSGKSRSARDGSGRRSARWRVLFLSSGEIGLAEKVAEDGRGKQLTAGQQVRIVDIPADAGAGFGLFEELHGFPSAEALSSHLRLSATTFYGVAARRFLVSIIGDLHAVRTAAKGHTQDFVLRYVPDGADGQVHRVAQRFALIAAAGELAVAAGILPWKAGEATKAAVRVYRDWLVTRGGVEPAEIRAGITQIRAFLLAHGMARFVPAWEECPASPIPVRDVAGFRRHEADGWDYYVTTSAWRDVLCQGLDSKALASILAQRGLLIAPSSGSHRAKAVSVPGHSKLRLYHLPARFLEADYD
jgi:uncharacterized protein (DUF927 family)